MTLPLIELQRIDGTPDTLTAYNGKALLVVNVASQCGFTAQYRGLEQLYQKYKDRGLVVMGFPCNQFGGQEPGSAEEIAAFCTARFDLTFPMFQKCEVNGNQAHPLFVFLKSSAPGLLGSESIKWNFTKFLINRQGEVTRRFAPTDTPEKIETDLAAVL